MSRKKREYIADTENVARCLYHPSMVADGIPTPEAFRLQNLPRGSKDYISVLRCSKAGDVRQYILAANWTPRNSEDSLYGHCVLNVGDIRSIAENMKAADCNAVLDVIDKKTQRNPAHAGITLTIDDELVTSQTIDGDVILIMELLAEKCIRIEKYSLTSKN